MHILWLKTELLHPVDKGGKIRTYQMLRALKAKHRITYLTLDDTGGNEASRAHEYCDRLITVPFHQPSKRSPRFYGALAANLFSRLPYAVAKYRAPEMTRQIEDVLAGDRVDVIVCDFLFPSINCPAPLDVPAILFQHNVEAAIWQRHAAVAVNPIARRYLRAQWRRMREHERRECHRFDHVVAVSREDRDVFAGEYGVREVSDVPTGVDTGYFTRSSARTAAAAELVFTGSMDWLPNEDAMRWFEAEILPRIAAAVLDVHLTIVGRSPSAPIRELASRNGRISITGSVPDVRPFLERAAVFVVPIRVGGGTRLKIFEAMAMEVPVVSTTIGAEGLPVRAGEELLLADDADAFAASVIRLLRSPADAGRIARTGAARVRREFSWQEAAARFAATCEAVRAGRVDAAVA